jgi:ATP-dependent DNA helicase RecG
MEVNLIQGRRSKRHGIENGIENSSKLGDGIENGIENDTSLQSRDRKKEILRLMKMLPKITVRELANELSSSPRTISRDISFMINQGVLNREGGDKGGTWIVKEE